MIHLACLRGNIGYWTYYSTVIKVKDIVSENLIITVAESAELYTQNINKILQRELKQSRIKSISTYIEENDERFFSSLIVAIHKGSPKWTDVNLFEKVVVENSTLNEEEVSFLGSKYGILSLSGDEQIFALDGQHRLKGIRKAFIDKPELADIEIPVIFVIHNHSHLEKTRRLFTVLNKYAQKPNEAELIILDEDDANAILTRKIIEQFEFFAKKNVISNTNSSNLASSDYTNFTTLVTLNRIHSIVLSRYNIDATKRPSEELLETYYIALCDFWRFFLHTFPQIFDFVDGHIVYINEKIFNRNKETGGSIILRPIGQIIFAKLYINFRDSNRLNDFEHSIKLVDFDLNSQNCKYIFYLNGRILPKEESLKNRIFNYLFGLDKNEDIHNDISIIYKQYGVEYQNRLIPVL